MNDLNRLAGSAALVAAILETNGRAGEIRTHDLTHPKRARYQLRYGPISLPTTHNDAQM